MKILKYLFGEGGKKLTYALSSVFLLYFCVSSLILTYKYDNPMDYEYYYEIQKLYYDNILINIVLVIGFVLTLYLIYLICDYFKDKMCFTAVLFTVGIIIVFGISFWTNFAIEPRPVWDAMNCSNMATDMINSTVDQEHLWYMSLYPFQLGYAYFIRVFYAIFGVNNYTILRLLNVLSVTGVFAGLVFITQLVFRKENITRFAIVLLSLCIALPLASLQVYNLYYEMALAIWGMLFAILYAQRRKLIFIIFSLILFLIGGIIKPNILIFAIATMLFFIILSFENKSKILALVGVLILLVSIIPINFAQIYFESENNVELYDEIKLPSISWINFGLSEKAGRPGKFFSVSADDDFKGEISRLLTEYIKNPQTGISFFHRKLTGNWCEPTMQSVFYAQFSYKYFEWPAEKVENKFLQEFMRGSYTDIIVRFLDILQITIYLFAFIFAIKNFKNPKTYDFLLVVYFLGGVLYHLISEVKVAYLLPYYLFLFPLAASGMVYIFEIITTKMKKEAVVK